MSEASVAADTAARAALGAEAGAVAPSRERERLPSGTKLFYGLPSFVGAAMTVPIVVHMQKFYSDVVLLPVGYLALAIAVARGLDAIVDPFFGWLSDRTRSRWGRRKPWIFAGVPFCAFSFYLLFNPPSTLEPAEAAWWFSLAFASYFLFHSVYEVAYAGLGSELSTDYHERSSLFGWRSMCIGLGTIVAGALPTILQFAGIGDDREIFHKMSSFYTVLLIVLFGLMLLKVREKKEYLSKTSNPLVPGVRRALRNRPFRVFLTAAIVYSIPVMMPSLLMPYYVSYVLQPENPLTWLGIYLVLYLGSGVLCVPFWVKLSYRYGKLRVWLVCNVIGVLGGAALFFAGKGDLGYVALIEVLVGTQSGAFYFLGPAMVADVIDYDELRTGKRREAQYMAFMTIIPKFVAIPGASIPLAVMGTLGYQPNAVQNDDVQRAIRLMFALVPALFNLAALFIVLRYPLTEAVHSKIRHGLGQHARGEVARDPITDKPVAPPGHGSVNEQTGWFLDHFSPRELRRLASSGASAAVRSSVRLAFGLALLALCGTTWVAVQSVHGLEASPGPMTVLAVVGAGLSLTWLLYEALRVLAAIRLVRSPPDRGVVVAHLDSAEW